MRKVNHSDNIGNSFGVSEDFLEEESKHLDVKYNDLLNIFIEKDSVKTK